MICSVIFYMSTQVKATLDSIQNLRIVVLSNLFRFIGIQNFLKKKVRNNFLLMLLKVKTQDIN